MTDFLATRALCPRATTNEKGNIIMEENKLNTEDTGNETPTQDDTTSTVENAELEATKAELEATKAELEATKAELEAARAALKDKDDKYLRMAAEYDNFRRRSREEKEATYGSALADTVKEILPIIDNLERASSYEDGEKVRAGLVMLNTTVSQALGKLGVEAFGEVGETFDPNLHNAVLHEEDDSDREGIITEVFQRGYRKGNRIIRFAMVKTVN